VWYLVLQAVWLKRFNDRWSRAILVTAGCFLKATFVVLFVATAIALALME
jgi:hypothetical protein